MVREGGGGMAVGVCGERVVVVVVVVACMQEGGCGW